MKPMYLFLSALFVVLLLVAGCTTTENQTNTPITTNPSTMNPIISTNTQTVAPITTSSTHPWTCYGSNDYYSFEPRSPIVYQQGDPNTPHYQSLPAPQPTPSYNGGTMQTDPIIGTYIFDPSQFKSSEVERLEYFSKLSSSEFYYVVPLDISPDIKWTFRDDGILLFFQNNITSSNSSLRRFWRNSSGYFLRSGTWKVLDSGKDKTTYQISWGCVISTTHTYIVTYDKNGVSLTQPNILKMIKIE